MSCDYLMFRQPGIWPQWIKRLQVFLGERRRSLGTPEELMEKITELFPETQWKKLESAPLKAVIAQVRNTGIDPGAPAWFGGLGPEFQLSADLDGQVKSMMVSRVERREIRLLCRRLGLVYLDLQAEGLLGILFR